MKNSWVISDTHFNHERILSFEVDGKSVRPGFANVQEMNEKMIDNWNKVVKPGDHVYHLGDVLFGMNKEGWMNIHWPRLNGKKFLVVGNHDNIKMLSAGGWFSKIQMWYEKKDLGLTMTHVPIHESGLYDHRHAVKSDGPNMVNVHGHIHSHLSPTKHHVCVCVEQTDYSPVNLESLRDKIRT